MSSSQATESHPGVLRALAQEGLLGVGVPRELGGTGGDVRDVLQAVAREAEHSLARGIVLASQRLLIEVLLQSENVGLMEYQLPRLLEGDISGNCAASWPGGRMVVPSVAHDTGRGWRATGELPAVPNLQRDWFLLSAPIRFEGSDGYSLVLLKSDEDGVDRRSATAADPQVTPVASVELRNVFLREDEILSSNGAAAVEQLAILSLGMRAALAAGASRRHQPRSQ